MDNDLMARRLRPPSETPRPQNGHSPLPSDTPPWAATPDSGAEVPGADVPWDRPQAEAWPPVGTDDEPLAGVWPPAPAVEQTPAAETPAAGPPAS
jgi:hypothetical protein